MLTTKGSTGAFCCALCIADYIRFEATEDGVKGEIYG